MIAMTRDASMTPSSISFASSLASATEWIGTLRTSMASGMRDVLLLVGYDDGPGRAGHRLGEMSKVGDHGPGAAALDEPAGGVDLGAHRAAGEVTLRGVRPQLRGRHDAHVARLRRTEVQDRVGDVGADDEHVGLDRLREQ